MKIKIILIFQFYILFFASIYCYKYQVENRTGQTIHYKLNVAETIFPGILAKGQKSQVHETGGMCFSSIKVWKDGEQEATKELIPTQGTKIAQDFAGAAFGLGLVIFFCQDSLIRIFEENVGSVARVLKYGLYYLNDKKKYAGDPP